MSHVKNINVKTLLLALILFTLNVSNAQWHQDERLTNDAALSFTSVNNSWNVAASGKFIHIVWYDTRSGNAEIFYKRSTDQGMSWETDTRLTNNSSFSEYPSVAASDSIVHVVWHDSRDGNSEIYYKSSTDRGITWGLDKRLTTNSNDSRFPSVAISGPVVHVTWHDHRDGNYEIYYKLSLDGGINWEPDTRLTNNSGESAFPSVTISVTAVHVAWFDNRDGNPEIYYKRSADGGINWESDTRLTNDSAVSYYPSFSVSGSVLHVVWFGERDGNMEIYHRRSSDDGISWEQDSRLTNNPASSEIPSVTASGSAVHVVWQDNRDGNAEIYYKLSTDGGLNWGTDTRLTNNPGISFSPSVSAFGSVVSIVWYDGRDGNPEIYYKRNPTGNPGPVHANIRMIIEGFYNISMDNLNMKDTLKVYLRNTFSPFDIIDSAKPVIDSLTFTLNFIFNNVSSGLYYIILKHRNSIETWSKSGGEEIIPGSSIDYDFTLSSLQSFGNNMKQVNPSPVRFGIFSGDVDQDGIIDLNDIIWVYNDASEFVSGHVTTDINGDNSVNLSDVLITYNNSNSFVHKITP